MLSRLSCIVDDSLNQFQLYFRLSTSTFPSCFKTKIPQSHRCPELMLSVNRNWYLSTHLHMKCKTQHRWVSLLIHPLSRFILFLLNFAYWKQTYLKKKMHSQWVHDCSDLCCDLSLVLAKSVLVGLSPLDMSNVETFTIHLRMKAWIAVFRFKRERFYKSCLLFAFTTWWIRGLHGGFRSMLNFKSGHILSCTKV